MEVILIVILLTLPFILLYIGVILYAGKYMREMKDEDELIYKESDEMLFMH